MTSYSIILEMNEFPFRIPQSVPQMIVLTAEGFENLEMTPSDEPRFTCCARKQIVFCDGLSASFYSCIVQSDILTGRSREST